METPPRPDEVIRVLDGMSFFQKRALKKAGFRWDGLRRLAGSNYGARLVEAVLACHTELLGREPRADEPEKAKAAHRHPGVPGPEKTSFDAPRYSHLSRSENEALAKQAKERRKAAREERRLRRDRKRS